MNNDINLVSSDAEGSDKETKRLESFRLIATILIVGVGFISVLLFVLNRLFSPAGIVKEQEQVATNITLAGEKHAKLTVLTQRLNDISSLLSKRTDYDIVLNEILAKSGGSVSIASLAVDKQKLSMIVSADSLISTNEFIGGLKSMVQEKKFLKNVIVNSLSLNNRASNYTLTLEIELL
ncbi:MAG: hypothetical protein WD992_02190 [Candidatus Levyibacteriota bacterium]